MTTIRLYNVTKVYQPEHADVARSYGQVLGLATEYASRQAAREYKHELKSAGQPPEPRRLHALAQVNLEIHNSEVMGVIGPSGCGKTTLLKVLAGLIEPDEGVVTYDGQDMADISPGERSLGIVFQDYALYPHMKSQGNIGFFFKVHNRADEIPERVRYVSEIMGVGFEKLLARKPPTLSGGERQRVALARCIARDPQLFLFDEPLSSLDAKLRVQTRVELKRLFHRFKITAIYVTHDQVEATALCDRLAVMREGRIEQVGTYDQLIARPLNTFVAAFVGIPPMNIFEGHWTSDGWQGRDFSWKLPEGRRHPEGRRGALGIRPEHVRIRTDSEDRGEVGLIEPLVSERVQLVHIECGMSTVVARVPIDVEVRHGDNLTFSFDPAQIHLFDGTTERRLD